MSKLTINGWSGKQREVEFVGYNRNHTACFIRDEEKHRRAITLLLPKLFDLHFRDNPIGKAGSPPIIIRRAMLHLPACFTSKEQKESFDDLKSTESQCAFTMQFDAWKVRSPHKCWLEPKDDEKLSGLLREEMDRWRRRHIIREKETAEQIAALPAGETIRAQELRDMHRGEFTTFADGADGHIKFISIFDTTLEMVRKGWGALYTALLEQEWSEHFGWNLQTIPTEAAAFHSWVEKKGCNARQRTTDWETRTVEIGHGLRLDPWQWEFLEAGILYEVRFADGSRCWLDDFEERNIIDPQEVEDFEGLESAQKTSPVQNPTQTKWHSEDFREIYMHDRVGRLKGTAFPHNSLRALCLLLAGHTGKLMPFTEIEPRIGALASELDKADKVKKPSSAGSHQIRDLVNRTKTGKKLKRWSVLTLVGSRERFIKLAPPAVK